MKPCSCCIIATSETATHRKQQPYATLLANKVKGNIKVNIVDPPGFGPTKQQTIEDLALLTNAVIINEELGDDLDLIDPNVLGSAFKAVTDDKNTVLQVGEASEEIALRIIDVEKQIEEDVLEDANKFKIIF